MTEKQFKKLKVGDKVKIKKYCPTKDDLLEDGIICNWTPGMSKFIGMSCVVSYVGNGQPYYGYFNIAEDDNDYWFHYKAIDEVISEEAKDYTSCYNLATSTGRCSAFKKYIPNVKYDKFDIDKVIFNEPATIVLWKDGSKTVVKCGEDDYFDREKGLAMAIAKRALGDKGNYYNVFKKHDAVDCDDETYVPLSLLKECTTFKKFKELMALVDD